MPNGSVRQNVCANGLVIGIKASLRATVLRGTHLIGRGSGPVHKLFKESDMKSTNWIQLGLVTALMALSGCEQWMEKDAGRTSTRDISTPSARLLGHWKMYSLSDKPYIDLYFGPVDENSTGTFILIDPEAGRIPHTYRIKEDRVRRDEVLITHHVSETKSKDERLFLHKDGENGFYYRNFLGEVIKQRIRYVGPETSPDRER